MRICIGNKQTCGGPIHEPLPQQWSMADPMKNLMQLHKGYEFIIVHLTCDASGNSSAFADKVCWSSALVPTPLTSLQFFLFPLSNLPQLLDLLGLPVHEFRYYVSPG